MQEKNIPKPNDFRFFPFPPSFIKYLGFYMAQREKK